MALQIQQYYFDNYSSSKILNISYLILIKQLDSFVADNLCSLTDEEFLDAKMYYNVLQLIV